MGLTERGRWTNNKIDERGRIVINTLTEMGIHVFAITGVPVNPSNPPNVSIVSIDHYKISNQSSINQSDIVFKFDSDVTSWTVNVIGTSYNSGTVVASGGIVASGNNISVSIPYNDMYQEGNNQINIYGKNSVGWTPYMDNN